MSKAAVSARSAGQKMNNFWNNYHFHPTDAVEDMWGQKILDQVKKDNVAEYVRLYTMFETMTSLNEKGEIVMDFTEQDKRFDYMVNAGYKILLCYNFMPVELALTPTELSGRRYKDRRFCRSNPKDYTQWQEMCRRQAQHLVDRYGVEVISQWKMHCWNEPDLGFWIYPKFFFECTPEEQEYKIVEYCKLYDHFEAGIHSVSDRLLVGGPSCGHYKDFFRRVLKHVTEETNYVTGKKGTRFDFASLHCYSSIPQDVHDPLRYKIAPESIVNQYKCYRAIMAEYGLDQTPAVIDEWAAAAEGYLGIAQDPRMRFRETEYYAAFYFKLIDLMSQLPLPPEKMMICLSGQDFNTEDFDGHRTFFTASGWRKPIYNAFAMAARFGGQRLPMELDLPANVGAIATVNARGDLQIALYNHVSDFGQAGNTEAVKLSVTDLPENFKVTRRRIDETFSNAYTAWCRLNCPPKPTVWEREQISRRAELEKCRPEETGSKEWTGETVLTPNSVEFLEFEAL